MDACAVNLYEVINLRKYYDAPQILKEFLTYHETIKGQSQLTISEYYLDLRMFLRFIKLMRGDMPMSTPLEDINIKNIDYLTMTINFKNGKVKTILPIPFFAGNAAGTLLAQPAQSAL